MKYIYKKENIQVKRDDKSGTASLMVKEPHYQLVLNKVANVILERLDKYDDTDELIDDLLNLFESVDRENLEGDVIEILKNFELFEVLELIEENEKNEKNIDSMSICMYGDLNYKKVSEFILNQLSSSDATKIYVTSDKRYYAPVALRYRTMQNEEYGIFIEKDGEILAVMNFSIFNAQLSNVVTINSFFWKENLDIELYKETVLSMINHILKTLEGIKNICKFRFTIVDNEETKPIAHILQNIGFEKECVLKKESSQGDMAYFTYFC